MHFVALTFLLLLTSCSEVERQLPETYRPIPQAQIIVPKLKAHKSNVDARLLAEIGQLTIATSRFLDNPTEGTRSSLQERWVSTHTAFTRAQFSLLTRSDLEEQLLHRLDAWPIQPGFLDNLDGYPESGIVFDATLTLTPEALKNQHGITNPEEAALGLHAMELLIFSRPLEDFSLSGDQWVERRRILLDIMSKQLLVDAQQLVAVSKLTFEESDAEQIVRLFLTQTLEKTRNIFRESNLVAAQGAGHSVDQARSMQILLQELSALKTLMVEDVGMVDAFENLEDTTLNNFLTTINEAPAIVEQSVNDEIALANVPLVLSALSHQLEAFDQALNRPH